LNLNEGEKKKRVSALLHRTPEHEEEQKQLHGSQQEHSQRRKTQVVLIFPDLKPLEGYFGMA